MPRIYKADIRRRIKKRGEVLTEEQIEIERKIMQMRVDAGLPPMMARPKSGYTWKPGQSGNPKGRPKGSIINDAVKMARKKTGLAVDTLAKVCKESNDDRAKVIAAKELLDRGWGKVKFQDEGSKPSAFVELLRMLNGGESVEAGDRYALPGSDEDGEDDEGSAGPPRLAWDERTIDLAPENPEVGASVRDGADRGEAGEMAGRSLKEDF